MKRKSSSLREAVTTFLFEMWRKIGPGQLLRVFNEWINRPE
jgi:hypothetical protein